MTGLELCTRALRLIHAIGEGETPTSETAIEALATLNDLVDSWKADSLTVYALQRVTKALSANVGTYTIGTGGAINVARPLWLSGATAIVGTTRYPLEVLDDDGWRRERDRSSTGAPADRVYLDRAFPLATLYVLPVPSAAYTLELELPVTLTAFADLTTDYSFPPGYARALRYNLAMELAPAEGAAVPPAVGAIAVEALALVKRVNMQTPEMELAPMIATIGGGGVFDAWRG